MATKKTTPAKLNAAKKKAVAVAKQPRPPGRRGAMPGERWGGRAKGTKNKKTIIQEQLAKVKEAAGMDDLLTPLQFMLNVVNDDAMPTRFRGDMAKNAAPYVHPKLVAVTMKSTSKVLNVDAQDAIASGAVDAEALYRDIMGSDDESEDD